MNRRLSDQIEILKAIKDVKSEIPAILDQSPIASIELAQRLLTLQQILDLDRIIKELENINTRE